MNRLIIIGNGFDLAHGIKTSYKDLILNYLANVVNSFYKSDRYEDDLISIQFKNGSSYGFYDKPNPATAESVFEIFENLRKNRNFDIILKSLLLERTLARISEMNWVDL